MYKTASDINRYVFSLIIFMIQKCSSVLGDSAGSTTVTLNHKRNHKNRTGNTGAGLGAVPLIEGWGLSVGGGAWEEELEYRGGVTVAYQDAGSASTTRASNRRTRIHRQQGRSYRKWAGPQTQCHWSHLRGLRTGLDQFPISFTSTSGRGSDVTAG